MIDNYPDIFFDENKCNIMNINWSCQIFTDKNWKIRWCSPFVIPKTAGL